MSETQRTVRLAGTALGRSRHVCAFFHTKDEEYLALIEEVLQGGKAQGHALTGLVANMEWALEDRPGVKDIVEYEPRLNFVLPNTTTP